MPIAPTVYFHTPHSSAVSAAQPQSTHRAFALPALSPIHRRGDAWRASTGARNPPPVKLNKHCQSPHPVAPVGPVNSALLTTFPTQALHGNATDRTSLNLHAANSTESKRKPSPYPHRLTQTLSSPLDTSTLSLQQKSLRAYNMSISPPIAANTPVSKPPFLLTSLLSS